MNTDLEDQVRASFERDPKILEPLDIAVAADGAVVTLRGTVADLEQVRLAVGDARGVAGVAEVKNELTMHLRDDVWDDEIRGAALQSLIWDADVPEDTIDVKVSNGWVTLKGTVEFQSQSDAAVADVEMVKGVGGVTNEIKVVAR
jgi:osmotically-inducible protein OsmY